jgi:hypothetical protein
VRLCHGARPGRVQRSDGSGDSGGDDVDDGAVENDDDGVGDGVDDGDAGAAGAVDDCAAEDTTADGTRTGWVRLTLGITCSRLQM